MKLVSFEYGGRARLGALVSGYVVDLNRAAEARERAVGTDPLTAQRMADAVVPPEATAFIRAGAPAIGAAGEAIRHALSSPAAVLVSELMGVPAGDAKLLPPVPAPPKIICVARNYAEHAREAGLELPSLPILFTRFANTLVAPGGPVVVPAVSDEVDWEGELAIVIGRGTTGRITREEALDYVFGYSIFNDVTVRDYQFRVTQYTAGKNFRASGPFGPYMATPDEIGDPQSLNITTTVNGEVMQSANTSTMIFDIPTLLVHVADFIDLEAGDVIITGTPAGVGFKREPPLFLKPGDTVAVSIDGLGTLSNPVIDEAEAAR